MTPKQENWLKTRLAKFGDAHVNKTTTKEFFPAVFKDWRKCWVTPDPSQEEITEAGNVEKATLKKKMMDYPAATTDLVSASSNARRSLRA